MIDLWMLPVGIYVIVAVFVTGIGIGDELSFSNSDYTTPIIHGVLWPVTLWLAVVVYFSDDM